MASKFKLWQENLVSMGSQESHKETLSEIEFTILESSASDDKAFRLKAIWLLRHLSQLI